MIVIVVSVTRDMRRRIVIIVMVPGCSVYRTTSPHLCLADLVGVVFGKKKR